MGSGKSSLLSSLVGEISVMDDNIENKSEIIIEGSVGYVSQNCETMMNGSIRDNIVLSKNKNWNNKRNKCERLNDGEINDRVWRCI